MRVSTIHRKENVIGSCFGQCFLRPTSKPMFEEVVGVRVLCGFVNRRWHSERESMHLSREPRQFVRISVSSRKLL